MITTLLGIFVSSRQNKVENNTPKTFAVKLNNKIKLLSIKIKTTQMLCLTNIIFQHQMHIKIIIVFTNSYWTNNSKK